MNERFHIIIAGDERKPLSFQISQKKFTITSVVTLCVVVALSSAALFAPGTYVRSNLKRVKKINTTLQQKIVDAETLNKKTINDLQTQITMLKKKNLAQKASYKKKRDLLLATAVSELNQRSKVIENVISDIGIKVESKTKGAAPKNSGGPFVAAENAVYDDLLYRVDGYLKTIQDLPLGKPVKGSISSWYGKRKDPLNGKNAFHEGIDFRGSKGDPVYATANGKVTFAGKNGGFGKCVKINHGNGYITSFAHLNKYHVHKGDYVSRGQIIGLVGNSGRSTGSHLHYEIAYRGKHVNPSKFIKVASLTSKFDSSLEK